MKTLNVFKPLTRTRKLHGKKPLKRISIRSMQTKNQITETTTPSYFEFAEKVNGRAAQQGFIWGAVNEAYTGNDVKEQLFNIAQSGNIDINYDDVFNAIIVIGLITLGTAITTIVPNDDLENKSRNLAPIFTDEAELINGRIAMLGFVALAILY